MTPSQSVGWLRAPQWVGIEPGSQSSSRPSPGLTHRYIYLYNYSCYCHTSILQSLVFEYLWCKDVVSLTIVMFSYCPKARGCTLANPASNGSIKSWIKPVHLRINTNSPGESLPLHTDNGEELIGAAVREEAAHGVPTWEGGQTLLAILMGL